jgi:hypothetical protein
MPRRNRGDEPRTNLPPVKDPYYGGYFGTDEEEGVVRERDAEEADERERGAEEGGARGGRKNA